MWKIFKTTLCVYDPTIKGYSKPKQYDEYSIIVTEGKKEESNSLRFSLQMNESRSKIEEISFSLFYFHNMLNEIETLVERENILKLLKEYLTEENISNLKNKFVDKIKYIDQLIKLTKRG